MIYGYARLVGCNVHLHLLEVARYCGMPVVTIGAKYYVTAGPRATSRCLSPTLYLDTPFFDESSRLESSRYTILIRKSDSGE